MGGRKQSQGISNARTYTHRLDVTSTHRQLTRCFVGGSVSLATGGDPCGVSVEVHVDFATTASQKNKGGCRGNREEETKKKKWQKNN